MKKQITFDFDGTLSQIKVQSYAASLIQEGFDVWVLTSRYDDLNKHLYPLNPSNEDLWTVIDNVGIPREKVVFMNMHPKHEYLRKTNVVVHLEDDQIDIYNINNNSSVNTIAVDVNIFDWRARCDCFLGVNK